MITGIILKYLPLYTHIKGHFALYYLLSLGTGAGPMILNWISEITGGDNEARAINVALGNDLAYVVQAVAPNFVWKTTSFPNAQKGFNWSSELYSIFFWGGAFLLIAGVTQLGSQHY